jgi:predicted GNAT superfamily acetyltransferase
MTAVSRSLQGSGIGFELKLAQRNEALRQGIPEIAWTFDPLQARNAHFNLRKLGVVAGHYEDNFYGVSSSGLHNGLPTDRLRVSWVLSSERVEDRVSHAGPVIIRDFDGIVRALECRDGTPGKPNLLHRETPLMLEAPPVYPEGQQAAGGSARDWQDALRTTFRHYFGLGYSATDFIFVGTTPPRAFYVLERA